MEQINLCENKVDKNFILHLEKDFTNEKLYISNGWIDSHVHLFSNKTYYLDNSKWDKNIGVICYIDAGSIGVHDLKNIDFNKLSKNHYVYSLININPLGLNKNDELNNLIYSKSEHKKGLLHPSVIGSKMRLSTSVLNSDKTSFFEAMEFLKTLKKPTMFHIGNSPPKIYELHNLFKKNDVITHYAHGKNNDYEMLYKKNPNHLRDIGYGNASFNIEKFKKMFKANIFPDIVSTDLHNVSFKNNSVRLNIIMSLLMELGMELKDIIDCITVSPYNIFLKNNWKNYFNDAFTAFKIIDKEKDVFDSDGNKIVINKIIVPVATYTKKGGYKKC